MMHPTGQEPGMDALLARLGRDLPDGATPEEFEQLERLAGRPLPSFYRWFVSRMGRRIGSFGINSPIDFSAPGVIAAYADELVEPDPRYFLIGVDTSAMTPSHLFYDLDREARDDARVVAMEDVGDEVHGQFETLREMLAWHELRLFAIYKSPQACRGVLTVEDEDVRSHLDPVLASLGLEPPEGIPTGKGCGLYIGTDTAMTSSVGPDDDEPRIHVFDLGGPNEGVLRRILGELSIRDVGVEITEWQPPLPDPA